MKILAETKGDFILLDPPTGQLIPSNRPAVIELTEFFHARTTLGQLIKIADAPDNATDADFAGFWDASDGNRDLAIASFLSQGADEEPTTKPTRRSK